MEKIIKENFPKLFVAYIIIIIFADYKFASATLLQ